MIDPDAPCENLFERLAVRDPARLVGYLAPDGLPQHLLTFAAEVAGRELPPDLVTEPLLTLLDHPSAVVREGAVYGIAYHLEDPRARRRIEEMASGDPSQGVRLAASDAVESYEFDVTEGTQP